MLGLNKVIYAGASLAFCAFGSMALADTIAPTSYVNDSLAVGDSVTIQKTVVVESSGPTGALLDVMFVFDTTGSMSGAINGAKSAATDILNGLSGFGNVASGVGYYADPSAGIVSDLTTTAATSVASINTLFACYSSCGGDYPEVGNLGVYEAADGASWRPGSNRFIITFGDAPYKDNPSDATVIAKLAEKNVDLIGLAFSGSGMTASVEELGGTVYSSGTSPADIIAAITAGITGGFADYTTVTVDDLGAGSPFIDVSVVCTGADSGACVGSDAVGTYDRSTDRTFTFDVTFTRTGAGDHSFATHALVDGGIVASEKDLFGAGGVSPVPLPAAGWLLIAGLGGMATLRRKKAA